MKHPGLLCLGAAVLLGTACRPSAPPPGAKSASPASPKSPTTSQDTTLRLKPDTVIASWQGGELRYGQLMNKSESKLKKLKTKYLQDQYKLEQSTLEEMLTEALVKRAAAAKKVPPEGYLKGIAGDPKVQDEEVLAFYNAQLKSSGRSLEAVRDQVRAYLVNNKKQKAVQAELARLRDEAKVDVQLPPPEAVVTRFDLEGHPMKGNKSADVTVVTFSDFECPYCARALPQMEDILEAYPQKVKLYFLHFPLSFHKRATPAAIASQCANLQGKFWAMHDRLFADQRNLTDERFLSNAEKLGLDMDKFKLCIKDPATEAFVKKDFEQGEAAGVQGTPSFYINGVAYPNGIPTVDAMRPYIRGS